MKKVCHFCKRPIRPNEKDHNDGTDTYCCPDCYEEMEDE